jgi:Sulfotransferase family
VLEQPNTVKTPVCIGGLGGGGTRVFAFFLKLNGYYLGSDLNDALDNLWYTLLFKRRTALLDPKNRFELLADLFFSTMQGNSNQALHHSTLLETLVNEPRLQETQTFLRDRMVSLIHLHHELESKKNLMWGWKEPNTHILIDRFLDFNKDLKYIHILRDPLYMAHSKNQNQFMNWGPILLGSKKELTSRNSLTFWCKSHERILSIKSLYPDRILIVKYEDMIQNTFDTSKEISSFLNLELSQSALMELNNFIKERPDVPNIAIKDFSSFDPVDLDYIDIHWKKTVHN